MWRIRSCRYSDLNALLALANEVGEGMTSIPRTSLGWRRKIAEAEASFAGQPDAGSYFLVLEDLSNGKILGTTAVYNGVGEKRPYFALRHDKRKHALYLENAMTGASEIGSLFLSSSARIKGLGRALSQARFLMMACFPQLFSNTVMASCRGWLDENNDSPVWHAIGQFYADIDFKTVVERTAEKGNQWLANALPITLSLRHISPEIVAMLGKPHDDSAPAHSILGGENFVQSDFIDLADGGPTLTCPPTRIASYKSSFTAKLERAKRPLENDEIFMIAGGNLNHFEIYLCRGERQSNNVILVDYNAKLLLDKHNNKRVKALQIQGSDDMLAKLKQTTEQAA